MVSFRNSWGDLDLYDNENVWGWEVQFKFLCDAAVVDGQICGASETNRDKWRLPVDFCRLDCQRNQPEHRSFCHLWQWEWMSDIMLDQLWPLYSPSGNVDEYLNHTLWLSLQLCASAPQNLSFLLILVAPASHFSFSLFSLGLLSLHLRIWFVMVTERGDRKKCLLQEKKMSLTCLNVFF